MGFTPNASGTAYIKPDEPDFELDFVTCRGRDGEAPLRMPSLGVTLQPLRFMEYSLEGTIETVLLSTNEPIAVRVPAPARYALHKLLIADERPGSQAAKARKDRVQSLVIIDALESSGAGYQLDKAWTNLCERGPTWRSAAAAGLERLTKEPLPEDAAEGLARSI